MERHRVMTSFTRKSKSARLIFTCDSGGEEVGGGGRVGKKLRGLLEEEVVEEVPNPMFVDPNESEEVGEGRLWWLPVIPVVIGFRGGIGGGG